MLPKSSASMTVQIGQPFIHHAILHTPTSTHSTSADQPRHENDYLNSNDIHNDNSNDKGSVNDYENHNGSSNDNSYNYSNDNSNVNPR